MGNHSNFCARLRPLIRPSCLARHCSPHKPALPLVLLARRRLVSGLLQDHLLMVRQTGLRLLTVGGVAGQDPVATHDAALHFVQPDQPPVFGAVGQRAFADDRRMRLKQAHHLLAGWHLLAFQNALLGLMHNLLRALGKLTQVLA